ncbi:MAG: C40 family peptidase [Ignavibacteria bacterium]|nr:C40 family peptidase [Ignavibacteria bacterium]
MLHEANSSVRTSVDHRSMRASKPPCPGRLLSFGSGVVQTAILAGALYLASCSGSSPRFHSSDTDEAKYAEKIRKEESLEDDRKVDLADFRNSVGSPYANATPPGVDRDAVLLDVVSYLGVPYRYGGGSKRGIDCSGFTLNVYRNSLGIALPRTAREQFQAGSTIPGDGLQFGDLVFFNTTGNGISHVGIYLEDDLFAHASVTYGVTISSLESSYYRKRYIGARRVVE